MGTAGRALADFVGLHAGRPAVLVGKGPSLDAALTSWPLSIDGLAPIVCVVNDVVGIVDADYCFACDPVDAWRDRYSASDTLFFRGRLWRADPQRVVSLPCESVPFWDEPAQSLEASPRAWVRDGIVTRLGTISMAAQIIRLMGCTRLLAIGIDGGTERAAQAWASPHASSGYDQIREAFISTCAAIGLPLDFFRAPQSC
jgi:hypothetical protein